MRLRTKGADIHLITAGAGPPLLLLHGYPQTHVMWRLVAPQLAQTFLIVAPDLRGYGESSGPPADRDHNNYSKRAMADDCVEIMAALGHHRFAVAGHDRGGRVAYRLALDHPECVARLAVLDILPTLDVWEAIQGTNALGSWHWLLLAQPSPFPEQLIAASPHEFIRHVLDEWAGGPGALDQKAVAEYAHAFENPTVIKAACEDYRAGATIDLEHDRADRAGGRKIGCPVLVLWSRRFLGKHPASPRAVWSRWADDIQDIALDCGHFVAEEQPDACATAMREFFTGTG